MFFQENIPALGWQLPEPKAREQARTKGSGLKPAERQDYSTRVELDWKKCYSGPDYGLQTFKYKLENAMTEVIFMAAKKVKKKTAKDTKKKGCCGCC